MAKDPKKELCIVAISGINYPTKHRKYLFNLVKEVTVKHEAVIVLVAGNTIDGKNLQKEFKQHLKHDVDTLKENTRELAQKAKDMVKLISKLNKKAQKAEKSNRQRDKERAKGIRDEIKKLQKESENFLKEAESFEENSFRDEFNDAFVEQHAQELSSLFPIIPNVNYHIAIAEKEYDLPIGVAILERLRELRDDIRLIGAQQDGTYDYEPKLPHQLNGFGEIRVVLPKHAPWYYRILSSFMQMLFNRFTPRTFSPRPDLCLIGCSGTAIYLPYYDGVPCISIPHLDKLNEQRSTENMVGASVIRCIVEKNRNRIIWSTYDFRPAIFNERNFSIPSNSSVDERLVLKTLISSPGSIKTILFRVLEQGDKVQGEASEDRIRKTLNQLIQKKIVLFNKKSNQYFLNEQHFQQAEISLEALFKNSKTLKETVTSCFHFGCVKTLYYTNRHYLPENAVDSDILVENGDGNQGIAHGYEYNGELLPTMLGYDKQERGLKGERARNIIDIFKLRLVKFAEEFKEKKLTPLEIIDRCWIEYIFQCGNHPGWKYWQKHSFILGEFEEGLKTKLVDSILSIAKEKKWNVSYEEIKNMVDKKVVRVGESFMVHTHGFVIGVKHPYKSRTESKSHRVQDVIGFIWREFFNFVTKIAKVKDSQGFVLANVANFHEAAAVHVAKFGRTALGLMTGAQVKDTRFEAHQDKVVDHGTANAIVIKNEQDRLLYSEVEFDNRIHPLDEKIVFADKIMTKDVLDVCKMLDEESDLPWRL